MENRVSRPSHWRIAVAVSVLLHGAVLLGAALVPARQVVEARTPPKTQYISFALDENDSGEVRFEQPRQPDRGTSLNSPKTKPPPPADSAAPVTATLRDTWDLAPATEFNPDTTGPSAIGQAPGSSASGVTTSFFQVAARGLRIVYVLDGSASMGANGALAAACRELRASAQKLPGLARFQIIIYNDQAHVLLPRYQDWLEPTPSVLQAVDDALESLARQVPEGGTDHEPALKMAFLLRPDVVYFLTDADDLKPRHLRLVRSLNQSRAIVHTIELNSRNRDRRQMPLQVMARENRGVYQGVDLGR